MFPKMIYSIDDEIFKQFPGYTRGVVLAFGVTNTESPTDLIALLREAELSLWKAILF